MIDNTVRMVIGSWGSYNACNERALGSKWLDLSDFSSWDDIEEELKNEGFELDGIDEELFVQDIEGIEDKDISWDYTHPKTIFDALNDSYVLINTDKFETMQAYLEVRSLSDFIDLVNSHGTHWDNDINLYKGYD